MKREIKFRAWDGEKMVTEGGYIQVHGSGQYDVFIEETAEWINKDCEIMQFTGLHDKNGKEIYEGDCDKVGNVVEFLNGTYCLNGDRPLYSFNFEIAGNIYEHPHLIQKEEVL